MTSRSPRQKKKPLLRVPSSTERERAPHWVAGVLCLLVVVAATVAAARHGEQQPLAPAVAVVPKHPVAQSRCAECHQEIVSGFEQAPHANTLHRATDPGTLAHFAGRTYVDPKTGAEYRYEVRQGRLWVSTSGYGRDVPIDWIFGSGLHAQTPLISWTGESGGTVPIEHRISWYPGDLLALTLGNDELRQRDTGISRLGHKFGPAEAATCFGCHSTEVPVTDNLQVRFEELVPNIGCVRCHWKADHHAVQMEAGGQPGIERLSQLPAREAVDRCGECHRRASEQSPGSVVEGEKEIVRFAPVGLVQSPCFLHQKEVELKPGEPARMDCVTCHDPHAAPKRDWQSYAQACLQCHDASQHRAADCPVSKRTDNCLPCHMPKVAMNPWLSFTDHWIRAKPNWPAAK